MIKMQRTIAPSFFDNNWKKWTKKYIETKKWNSSWHSKRGKIIKELKQMTNNHCAFCDVLLFPEADQDGQIEHFRPKSKFSCYAYAWGNLYPICERCNKIKSNKYNDLLLRPDAKNYDFFDWFRLNIFTFKLEPYKLGNPNWKRAEKTIRIYKLNDEDKIVRRKIEFDKISNKKYINKNVRPFRYISKPYEPNL